MFCYLLAILRHSHPDRAERRLAADVLGLELQVAALPGMRDPGEVWTVTRRF